MKPIKDLLTLADVDGMKNAEFENIAAKAIVRTGAMGEKLFPAKKADTRDPQVIAYVEEHFDNEDSPLYGEDGAAAIWAALKGITFNADDYTHEDDGVVAIPMERGIAVVPVNTRTFQWPKDFALEPLLCTQQGNRQSGWFRNDKGEKVVPPTEFTTLNSRPATREEILALVKGNLAVRPNEFIRNLGDSLPSKAE